LDDRPSYDIYDRGSLGEYIRSWLCRRIAIGLHVRLGGINRVFPGKKSPASILGLEVNLSKFMAKAFQHLIKYWLGLDRAQTQTTQAERDCIVRHATGRKRAVEIGVYEGVTTGTIAAALPPDATLFGIDPFIAGRIGICWGKPIARREARRGKPKCKVVFIEEFSPAAAAKIEGTFDFVFIDGDHSLDGITQDWQDWAPRLDEDGIIALHDTVVPAHNAGVANLGSHQYFVEHIQHDPEFELIEQVDSLSVLRRR